MNPKLLPRSSTRPAARTGTPTARPAAPATAPASPSPARVLRRPAVLALVAAGAVAVGALGWTQLTSSGSHAAPASVLVRPPATVPGTGTTSTGIPTPQDEIAIGRDPFADEPAPADTPPTTSPHVMEATLPSPSVDATTPSPAPTDSAPGLPSAAGTTSATPGVTVTVTASGGPTYVGLYAWNGSRASFRVNARTYSVAVGTRFGPGLQFASVVRGDPPCAHVTHAKGSFTLCPGQVTTLP